MEVIEKKMKTTIVCWGYIGRMEKNMETTIVYWGYMGLGQENGNDYNGLYGGPYL